MNNKVKVIWFGHSCFKIEYEGQSLVIDPYSDMPGYKHLSTSANIVLNSHNHFDHNYNEAVKILPVEGDLLFKIRLVNTFHDKARGSQRGPNLIHIIECGDLVIGHLGDLGHSLSSDKLKEIGHIDIAIIPVGGFYTIDAAEAKEICETLNPTVIIPMHYKVHQSQPMSPVEDFLNIMNQHNICHYENSAYFSKVDINKQIAVFDYKSL